MEESRRRARRGERTPRLARSSSLSFVFGSSLSNELEPKWGASTKDPRIYLKNLVLKTTHFPTREMSATLAPHLVPNIQSSHSLLAQRSKAHARGTTIAANPGFDPQQIKTKEKTKSWKKYTIKGQHNLLTPKMLLLSVTWKYHDKKTRK